MHEAAITQPPRPATSDAPIPLQEAVFARHYGSYREQRSSLHAAEVGNNPEAGALLNEVLGTKEKLAIAARVLYDSAEGNVPDFCRHIGNALLRSTSRQIQPEISPEDAVWLSYGVPLSRKQEISTPVEAIITTAENLEIAHEFAGVMEQTITGMLLTGTTAWGEFYAVRGGIRPSLHNDTAQRSDIDLLAIAPDIYSIHQTIESLVDAGMLESHELARFAVFKTLFAEGKADIFSLRAYYKGVEESLHLMPLNTAQAISNMSPIRLKVQGDIPVNFLYDFRPNIPNHLQKNGGYEVPDTKGLHKHLFTPSLQKVALANGTSNYIAESPIGGPFEINKQTSYGVGIMAFFLAVSPVVLIDSPDKTLAGIITRLQRNVANIQGYAAPASITRSERMPEHVLRKVKADLSLGVHE